MSSFGEKPILNESNLDTNLSGISNQLGLNAPLVESRTATSKPIYSLNGFESTGETSTTAKQTNNSLLDDAANVKAPQVIRNESTDDQMGSNDIASHQGCVDSIAQIPNPRIQVPITGGSKSRGRMPGTLIAQLSELDAPKVESVNYSIQSIHTERELLPSAESSHAVKEERNKSAGYNNLFNDLSGGTLFQQSDLPPLKYSSTNTNSTQDEKAALESTTGERLINDSEDVEKSVAHSKSPISDSNSQSVESNQSLSLSLPSSQFSDQILVVNDFRERLRLSRLHLSPGVTTPTSNPTLPNHEMTTSPVALISSDSTISNSSILDQGHNSIGVPKFDNGLITSSQAKNSSRNDESDIDKSLGPQDDISDALKLSIHLVTGDEISLSTDDSAMENKHFINESAGKAQSTNAASNLPVSRTDPTFTLHNDNLISTYDVAIVKAQETPDFRPYKAVMDPSQIIVNYSDNDVSKVTHSEMISSDNNVEPTNESLSLSYCVSAVDVKATSDQAQSRAGLVAVVIDAIDTEPTGTNNVTITDVADKEWSDIGTPRTVGDTLVEVSDNFKESENISVDEAGSSLISKLSPPTLSFDSDNFYGSNIAIQPLGCDSDRLSEDYEISGNGEMQVEDPCASEITASKSARSPSISHVVNTEQTEDYDNELISIKEYAELKALDGDQAENSDKSLETKNMPFPRGTVQISSNLVIGPNTGDGTADSSESKLVQVDNENTVSTNIGFDMPVDREVHLEDSVLLGESDEDEITSARSPIIPVPIHIDHDSNGDVMTDVKSVHSLNHVDKKDSFHRLSNSEIDSAGDIVSEQVDANVALKELPSGVVHDDLSKSVTLKRVDLSEQLAVIVDPPISVEHSETASSSDNNNESILKEVLPLSQSTLLDPTPVINAAISEVATSYPGLLPVVANTTGGSSDQMGDDAHSRGIDQSSDNTLAVDVDSLVSLPKSEHSDHEQGLSEIQVGSGSESFAHRPVNAAETTGPADAPNDMSVPSHSALPSTVVQIGIPASELVLRTESPTLPNLDLSEQATSPSAPAASSASFIADVGDSIDEDLYPEIDGSVAELEDKKSGKEVDVADKMVTLPHEIVLDRSGSTLAVADVDSDRGHDHDHDVIVLYPGTGSSSLAEAVPLANISNDGRASTDMNVDNCAPVGPADYAVTADGSAHDVVFTQDNEDKKQIYDKDKNAEALNNKMAEAVTAASLQRPVELSESVLGYGGSEQTRLKSRLNRFKFSSEDFFRVMRSFTQQSHRLAFACRYWSKKARQLAWSNLRTIPKETNQRIQVSRAIIGLGEQHHRASLQASGLAGLISNLVARRSAQHKSARMLFWMQRARLRRNLRHWRVLNADSKAYNKRRTAFVKIVNGYYNARLCRDAVREFSAASRDLKQQASYEQIAARHFQRTARRMSMRQLRSNVIWNRRGTDRQAILHYNRALCLAGLKRLWQRLVMRKAINSTNHRARSYAQQSGQSRIALRRLLQLVARRNRCQLLPPLPSRRLDDWRYAGMFHRFRSMERAWATFRSITCSAKRTLQSAITLRDTKQQLSTLHRWRAVSRLRRNCTKVLWSKAQQSFDKRLLRKYFRKLRQKANKAFYGKAVTLTMTYHWRLIKAISKLRNLRHVNQMKLRGYNMHSRKKPPKLYRPRDQLKELQRANAFARVHALRRTVAYWKVIVAQGRKLEIARKFHKKATRKSILMDLKAIAMQAQALSHLQATSIQKMQTWRKSRFLACVIARIQQRGIYLAANRRFFKFTFLSWQATTAMRVDRRFERETRLYKAKKVLNMRSKRLAFEGWHSAAVTSLSRSRQRSLIDKGSIIYQRNVLHKFSRRATETANDSVALRGLAKYARDRILRTVFSRLQNLRRLRWLNDSAGNVYRRGIYQKLQSRITTNYFSYRSMTHAIAFSESKPSTELRLLRRWAAIHRKRFQNAYLRKYDRRWFLYRDRIELMWKKTQTLYRKHLLRRGMLVLAARAAERRFAKKTHITLVAVAALGRVRRAFRKLRIQRECRTLELEIEADMERFRQHMGYQRALRKWTVRVLKMWSASQQSRLGQEVRQQFALRSALRRLEAHSLELGDNEVSGIFNQ